MINCVGVVRFSVLSTVKNPFKDSAEKTFSEYADFILSDERMENRFSMFESICLPSYDAQTDKDFVLLVVAPRLLPERWRARLELLRRGRNYLRIHYAHEEGFLVSSLTPMIAEEIVDPGQPFATFRSDDDDGVAKTFIKRLRGYIRPKFCGFGVSLTRGYYLDVNPTGDRFAITPRDRPNVSVGLALVSSAERPIGLFDLTDGHQKYHAKRPVIIDGRKNSYLLVNHGFNDTRTKRTRTKDFPQSVDEAQEELEKYGFQVALRLLTKADVGA